jgi:hypothetical protein
MNDAFLSPPGARAGVLSTPPRARDGWERQGIRRSGRIATLVASIVLLILIPVLPAQSSTERGEPGKPPPLPPFLTSAASPLESGDPGSRITFVAN